MISKIFKILLSLGFSVRLAKFITTQAVYETGNFSSKIFEENYNLFGMKQPKIRLTTSRGEKNGYASFNNYEDCVRDYRLYWENAISKIKDLETMEQFIDKIHKAGYFEQKKETYLKNMKSVYKKIF